MIPNMKAAPTASRADTAILFTVYCMYPKNNKEKILYSTAGSGLGTWPGCRSICRGRSARAVVGCMR